MKDQATPIVMARMKLALRGAVQGVGFRPFVYRLAKELGLTGWVNNSPQGVGVEVEGPRADVEHFRQRLETENPPRSCIQSLESFWLDAVGFHSFEIRKSDANGCKSVLVLPDIATCPDCLFEIFDPTNRRYRYPFTNCTNCGPRFSIIEALPYDRANTSMRDFAMCPACLVEYDDPGDRRFHAQPNACPDCGPHLELWHAKRESSCALDDALLVAAAALRAGQIVGVKGVGGFHLMADARNECAIRRLRERKDREEKPFALLFPSLEGIKAGCCVAPMEERLLCSPEAPIVLLQKRRAPYSELGPSIAPGNPNLGVMLPSNPLHHLLMAELGFPVVATSGNLNDEPICTDEHEAIDRLRGIADVFLVHNRPIVRHMDDSIVRVIFDQETVLRRARGYAPLPVQIRRAERDGGNGDTVVAVGAQLKNSVALAVGEQVFISQHIGDLGTEAAHAAFFRVVGDFEKLYDTKPEIIAADLHPDYLPTKFASETGKRVVGIQHHVAHVLSCMAENELAPPVLGVSWDGTGYGPDGTIWGGEFFSVTETGVERVAHLRPFRLPGGDRAVREPRRAALGLLYEMFGDAVFLQTDLPTLAAFTDAELGLLCAMLRRGLNAPTTSSMGRLFDAVASLTGLRQEMRFEGQAAMELEFALEGCETDEAYELMIGPWRDGTNRSAFVIDWQPMVEAILSDCGHGLGAGVIAARFHNALVQTISDVARRIGQEKVVLSGGCFQNRHLTERTVTRLREKGFHPYWHHRVPPNDGGIALGQVYAVRHRLGLRE